MLLVVVVRRFASPVLRIVRAGVRSVVGVGGWWGIEVPTILRSALDERGAARCVTPPTCWYPVRRSLRGVVEPI
jgi:hypothetical protein